MSRSRATTLVEILVGLALVSITMGLAYGFMHLMFWSHSRFNLTGLTRRSFLQKDAKAGIRRLIYRLREGIQILSPAPGTSSTELVFRDVLNQDIRLRQDATGNRVISERSVGGAWVLETEPTLIQTDNGQIPASWPVLVSNCPSIRFTAIAGDCVTVQASLVFEQEMESLLTVVKLRNAQQAY